MYSMLEKIDKHIREKGIAFNSITFNYSYLSDSLNQAILNEIRNIQSQDSYKGKFDFGCEYYTLTYDNNDNLCLLATCHKNKDKIAIVQEGTVLNIGYPLMVISEDKLIKKACAIEYIRPTIEKIKDRFDKENVSNNLLDRVKYNYYSMDTLVNLIIDDKNLNLFEKVNYKEIMEDITKKIIDYIDYLNDIYQSELKDDEKELLMEGISYIEPDADHIIRKNNGLSSSNNGERINMVISANDRMELLNSYPYLYREYAYSNNSKEINYLNYLYNLGNGKYVLIMEPYSGIKYTKIAIIDREDEITKEDFISLVRYYLQLSHLQINDDKSVIRCGHTSFETFKNVIQYSVVGVCENMTNEIFKKKIKGLKEKNI